MRLLPDQAYQPQVFLVPPGVFIASVCSLRPPFSFEAPVSQIRSFPPPSLLPLDLPPNMTSLPHLTPSPQCCRSCFRTCLSHHTFRELQAMASAELSRWDRDVGLKSASMPLRRLQSNLETNRRITASSESATERTSDPRPLRCRSLNPLDGGVPGHASARRMPIVSDESYRSPSSLEDIPLTLLRRYPRYSTAITSLDTGRPNFSADELTSTQLSDDEDDIVNDEPARGSTGSGALIKHSIKRDVRAIWDSNTTKLRCARDRLKRWPHKSRRRLNVQQFDPAGSLSSKESAVFTETAYTPIPLPALTLNEVAAATERHEVHRPSAFPVPPHCMQI